MGIIHWLKNYKVAFILSLGLAFLHFTNHLFSDSEIQPIKGDAQAYYAYLPAVFIYNDLGFEFVTDINTKYYPKLHQKSFLIDVDGEKVNKTFPGAAIYYLPFFTLAHLGAITFGLEADGYSTIYQVMFDVGYWFYFFLSLLFLFKTLLKLQFSREVSNITLTIIALSTNIFFYTIFNQSVTHIFNFFTVNLIVYLLLIFQETGKLKHLLLSLCLLALLGITRPTNILILLLFPIFLNLKTVATTALIHLKKIKYLILLILVPSLILLIPFLLWKIQTDNWIVYSYGEEGFNFTQPEVFNFLFSYTKGWFVYTPIALFILIFGLFILFKSDRRKGLWVLVFYGLSIYVFSSWWCWYYGAGQSQRVMIDSYLVLAFLLALILKEIKQRKLLFKATVFFSGLFVFLNVAQAFQIANGVLPHGSPTQEQYWDNFLQFKKRAKVYPKSHWILEKEMTFDLTPATGDVFKGNAYTLKGENIIQVASFEPYSGNLKWPSTSFTRSSRLVIKFEARTQEIIDKTRLVLDFNDAHEPFVYGFGEFLEIGEWTAIELLFEPNHDFSAGTLIYFWNGDSDEKVEIKHIHFSLYTTPNYM